MSWFRYKAALKQSDLGTNNFKTLGVQKEQPLATTNLLDISAAFSWVRLDQGICPLIFPHLILLSPTMSMLLFAFPLEIEL